MGGRPQNPLLLLLIVLIMVAGCLPIDDRAADPTSAPAAPSTGADSTGASPPTPSSPTPSSPTLATPTPATPSTATPSTATRDPTADRAALHRLCRRHCEGLRDALAAQDSCDYDEPGDCYRPIAMAVSRVAELKEDPDATAVADYLAIDLVLDNGGYFQASCRRPKSTGPPFDPSCSNAYVTVGVGLAQIESMVRS